ncbi:HAMP domain-containing protein [Streptomyces kaempferi]
MIRRFRSLPIRSRLALLVAAAVAFGVAAVSVTCWFIVRGKLYDEIDNNLQDQKQAQQYTLVQGVLDNCRKEPSNDNDFHGRFDDYAQVINSDGTVCVFGYSAGSVTVTDADKAVAKHPQFNKSAPRNGTDTKGNDVRVLAMPLVVTNFPNELPGTRVLYSDRAYVVAVPLKSTQATLNDLALVLLLVSGIGVVGAGAAGLAVARAGLRPVDKLTEAVEHVARTEDLSIRIPVEEGNEDEVARLTRSFNSMTSALANSRELQQQLIADAGHELRTPLTSLRTNIELLTRSEETGRPIPRPTAGHSSPPSRPR